MRKRVILYALAIFALVVVIQAARAPGTAATLENCNVANGGACGDTYVDSTVPNNNYGTAEGMYVGSNDTYRYFIKFWLGDIPAGSTINKATFYSYAYIGGASVGAYDSDNVDWSENVVTWNKQPAMSHLEDVNAPASGTWGEWRVDNAVRQHFDNGSDNTTIILDGAGAVYYEGYSMNCGAPTVRPYLEVDYTHLPSQTYSSPSGVIYMSSSSDNPTIGWSFSDADGDTQLGVKIQVTTDSGFNTITHWDYSDTATTAASKAYAGTALTRNETYYARVQVRDSSGDWSGTWSSNNFTVRGKLGTTIFASATVIDRDTDESGSGSVDTTTVYVTAQDNWGRDWINKCYIWIKDNTGAVVVDNAEVTSYENVDSTTKRFSYAGFNPDNSAQCGYYDVRTLAADTDGLENIKEYTGGGHQLFFVDDLTITGSLVTSSPVHKVGISGTISRVSGDAATADSARVVDNNEGTLTPENLSNTAYSDDYSLVSPTRLYRNSTGTVYAWARDDNLDGKCSSLGYTVQGDNATVTLGNINNQVGQSVVNFTVKWSDSANVGSGTAYHQDNTFDSTAIANGSGSFTLSHLTWKLTGATVITIDNVDRPLWNVSNATFNTDKLAWAENQPLSGTNDSASLTIKITYNDGSTNNTIKANLLVGTVDNLMAHGGQTTTDTNGLMAWSGIDLPDNSTDIQIRLDNVFDSRTDKVINARNVEDAAIYTSLSVSSFTIDGGASSTTSSTVTLAISASSVGSNVYQMCFSNGNVSWSTWESYSTSKSWSLSSGDELKTVYVKVRDSILNESNTSSTSITKATASNPPPSGGSSPPGGGYTPPDTTLPTLAVLEPTASIVGENVTIRVRASDASGIDSGSISVKLDGGTAQHSWIDSAVTSTFVRLSAGSHLVVVTANDASTNHNQTSINISFTVLPSTVENVAAIKNTAPTHTEVIAVAIGTLGAKENGAAMFDNENFSITRVAVAISESLEKNRVIENVGISAQVLENAPAEAASLPANVATYAYLEISTTAPENALASVTIDFKVSKAWLQASGMSPLAVTLYHLENGAWVELATTEVGEDNLYIFYSAVAPGLSPFMIGAKILFPTFNLQLPATPLEVENGYAQVMVWLNNPTPSAIVKHCKLRFENHVEFFDITVDPYENALVTVYVRVEGVAPGIHDVKLYDADTNTVLDAGQVTLLGMAEQSKTPVVVAAPPSRIPSIAVIGTAIGVVVGVGMLYITGRIPKIKTPSVKLPSVKTPKTMPPTHLAKRPFGVRKMAEELGEESLVVQMYHNILMPAAREFLEEDSPVVQGYYNLLSPVARERAKKNKVKHIGRAAKPYRSEK